MGIGLPSDVQYEMVFISRKSDVKYVKILTSMSNVYIIMIY